MIRPDGDIEAQSSTRGIGLASVAILWLGVSSLVFTIWLFHGRQFNTFPPATAERMTLGGANRPFSSRLLVPWIARALLAPIPDGAEERWVDATVDAHPPLAKLIAYFETSRSFAPTLFVIVKLDYLALFGFMVALYLLFSSLYRAPPRVAFVAPVVAVLLLPVFFVEGNHFIYDFPALLLFTLALWAIRTERWPWLYPLLALGALNKETIVFVVLAFALVRRDRDPVRRLWLQIAAQLGTVVVFRLLAVALSSPAGPDAVRNDYLRDFLSLNLFEFWREPFLLDYRSMAALLFFVVVVGWKFATKPWFLRRVLPIALPFFVAFLWGSRWGEIRALYEIYPILFLLGFHSLAAWLGVEVAPLDTRPAASHTRSPGRAAAVSFAIVGIGCLAVVAIVMGRILASPIQ